MKTMIIINGPIGIGKTWLAEKICPLLEGNRRILGLQPMVWLELQPLHRWTGSYAEFKSHIFEDGRTGREIMIEYIESRREIDTHYWDRRYIESPLFKETDIIINDSFRKFEEQEFYNERTNLITIVIAPPEYTIGAMYHGDSGICLAPWGGFRVRNSDMALAKFKDFWRQRSESNANANSHHAVPTLDDGAFQLG